MQLSISISASTLRTDLRYSQTVCDFIFNFNLFLNRIGVQSLNLDGIENELEVEILFQ